MVRRNHLVTRREELERLLDEIETGAIDDADRLETDQVELLREFYGDEEAMQDLLDRLRGGDRGER